MLFTLRNPCGKSKDCDSTELRNALTTSLSLGVRNSKLAE